VLLKVLTPHNIILKSRVIKIVGEGFEGSFGILPKHIDFTTKIVPSILFYEGSDESGYIAVDEGILVKQYDQVFISVREAVEKKDLGQLRSAMEARFKQTEEEERKSGMETTKLELGIVKSFYDLKKIVKE